MNALELLGSLRIDRETRESAFVAELGAALQECRDAVADTGKAASVTVKLTFKPLSSTSSAVECVDLVQARTPRREQPSTLLFANQEGFGRTDTSNPTLPGLRPVDGQRAG